VDRVEIVEVSPRDGLQNERRSLSTSEKVELVTRAQKTGVRRVEVTSFVRTASPSSPTRLSWSLAWPGSTSWPARWP
jgi:isopropylmalate/homocitrate/citramalate synthase